MLKLYVCSAADPEKQALCASNNAAIAQRKDVLEARVNLQGMRRTSHPQQGG